MHFRKVYNIFICKNNNNPCLNNKTNNNIIINIRIKHYIERNEIETRFLQVSETNLSDQIKEILLF